MKYGIFVVLGMLFGTGVVGKFEKDMQVKQLEQYCELVYLRQSTGDETIGWPDYLNVYEEQCTSDGALRPEYK